MRASYGDLRRLDTITIAQLRVRRARRDEPFSVQLNLLVRPGVIHSDTRTPVQTPAAIAGHMLRQVGRIEASPAEFRARDVRLSRDNWKGRVYLRVAPGRFHDPRRYGSLATLLLGPIFLVVIVLASILRCGVLILSDLNMILWRKHTRPLLTRTFFSVLPLLYSYGRSRWATGCAGILDRAPACLKKLVIRDSPQETFSEEEHHAATVIARRWRFVRELKLRERELIEADERAEVDERAGREVAQTQHLSITERVKDLVSTQFHVMSDKSFAEAFKDRDLEVAELLARYRELIASLARPGGPPQTGAAAPSSELETMDSSSVSPDLSLEMVAAAPSSDLASIDISSASPDLSLEVGAAAPSSELATIDDDSAALVLPSEVTQGRLVRARAFATLFYLFVALCFLVLAATNLILTLLLNLPIRLAQEVALTTMRVREATQSSARHWAAVITAFACAGVAFAVFFVVSISACSILLTQHCTVLLVMTSLVMCSNALSYPLQLYRPGGITASHNKALSPDGCIESSASSSPSTKSTRQNEPAFADPDWHVVEKRRRFLTSFRPSRQNSVDANSGEGDGTMILVEDADASSSVAAQKSRKSNVPIRTSPLAEDASWHDSIAARNSTTSDVPVWTSRRAFTRRKLLEDVPPSPPPSPPYSVAGNNSDTRSVSLAVICNLCISTFYACAAAVLAGVATGVGLAVLGVALTIEVIAGTLYVASFGKLEEMPSVMEKTARFIGDLMKAGFSIWFERSEGQISVIQLLSVSMAGVVNTWSVLADVFSWDNLSWAASIMVEGGMAVLTAARAVLSQILSSILTGLVGARDALYWVKARSIDALCLVKARAIDALYWMQAQGTIFLKFIWSWVSWFVLKAGPNSAVTITALIATPVATLLTLAASALATAALVAPRCKYDMNGDIASILRADVSHAEILQKRDVSSETRTAGIANTLRILAAVMKTTHDGQGAAPDDKHMRICVYLAVQTLTIESRTGLY
eukprot:4683984-Prymnesium_polylepis.1